jgi:hypothetical protein
MNNYIVLMGSAAGYVGLVVSDGIESFDRTDEPPTRFTLAEAEAIRDRYRSAKPDAERSRPPFFSVRQVEDS